MRFYGGLKTPQKHSILGGILVLNLGKAQFKSTPLGISLRALKIAFKRATSRFKPFRTSVCPVTLYTESEGVYA